MPFKSYIYSWEKPSAFWHKVHTDKKDLFGQKSKILMCLQIDWSKTGTQMAKVAILITEQTMGKMD